MVTFSNNMPVSLLLSPWLMQCRTWAISFLYLRLIQVNHSHSWKTNPIYHKSWCGCMNRWTSWTRGFQHGLLMMMLFYVSMLCLIWPKDLWEGKVGGNDSGEGRTSSHVVWSAGLDSISSWVGTFDNVTSQACVHLFSFETSETLIELKIVLSCMSLEVDWVMSL